MQVWEERQAKKGYLTWSEYLEAVAEDKAETPLGASADKALMRLENDKNQVGRPSPDIHTPRLS